MYFNFCSGYSFAPCRGSAEGKPLLGDDYQVLHVAESGDSNCDYLLASLWLRKRHR
ncbi:hypothetical protein EMIT0P258_50046 [Pseudomonas sp. IT-P258]